MSTPVPSPPPRRQRRRQARHLVWPGRLAAARAAPGQWFRLDGTFSRSVGANLRAGRFPGTVPGELEVTRRQAGRDRWHVFVRVIPEDERYPELDDADIWGEEWTA